jgi:streptogramin lyase
MALGLAGGTSVATAAVGDISEFSSGLHEESSPEGIAPGPDGQLWFGNSINVHPNAVGRITTTGSITEIYAPGEYIWPDSLVRGLDGNLWAVDGTKAIYRLTPDGEWTKFDEGPRAEFRPSEITRGPEGNFWFTVVGGEPRAIGRMTPAGQVTEYRAGLNPGDFPYQITAGTEGNVWFTDTGTTPAIGRVTPSGEIMEFSEGLGAGSVVLGITAGPDGDLWFTNSGTRSIGRITPTGDVTEFGLTLPFTTYPQDIAAGPDGNLWFTAPSVWTTSYIGRITTAGVITLFPMDLNAGGDIPYPHRISPGADGNMWFTDSGRPPAIGMIETGAPPAVETPPSMTGAGEVGRTLQCEGESWEAWAGEVPIPPGPGESPAPVQWTRDGGSIPGATQRTYTLGSDDRGHSINCTAAAVYPFLDVVATAKSNAVTLPSPPAPEGPDSAPESSAPEELQHQPAGELKGATVAPPGPLPRHPTASSGGGALIACLSGGALRYLAHPRRCRFLSPASGSQGAREIRASGLRWTNWGANQATAQGRSGAGKPLSIVAFHPVRCGGNFAYYRFVRLMRAGDRMEPLKLAAPGCGE